MLALQFGAVHAILAIKHNAPLASCTLPFAQPAAMGSALRGLLHIACPVLTLYVLSALSTIRCVLNALMDTEPRVVNVWHAQVTYATNVLPTPTRVRGV